MKIPDNVLYNIAYLCGFMTLCNVRALYPQTPIKHISKVQGEYCDNNWKALNYMKRISLPT